MSGVQPNECVSQEDLGPHGWSKIYVLNGIPVSRHVATTKLKLFSAVVQRKYITYILVVRNN